jgi:hypothetical protein
MKGLSNLIEFVVIIIILATAIWFCFYINTGNAFLTGEQEAGTGESIVRAPMPANSQAGYLLAEADSRLAISYLNSIRARYGKEPLAFDSRAYALATARAKDMAENNYIDHVNHATGSCADSMKADYGFGMNEYIAENIYFGDTSQMSNVIDAWLKSRGHCFNLLFGSHTAGAIGCYENACVFLGLNYIGFGAGCTTAAESDAFWQNAEQQQGEV